MPHPRKPPKAAPNEPKELTKALKKIYTDIVEFKYEGKVCGHHVYVISYMPRAELMRDCYGPPAYLIVNEQDLAKSWHYQGFDLEKELSESPLIS